MAAFSSTKNQLARMLKTPALTDYVASIAQRGFVTKSLPLQNASLVSTEQFGREEIEDIISMSQYVRERPPSLQAPRPIAGKVNTRHAARPAEAPTHPRARLSLVVSSLRHLQMHGIRNSSSENVPALLAGRTLGTMFYEQSTVTSSSFAAAIQLLGGKIIELDVELDDSLEDRCVRGLN